MAKYTKTKTAFAALVAIGLTTAAQAGTVFPQDQASYARWRVDAAFTLVAAMPVVDPVRVPVAMKGDLPVPLGCADVSGDAQDECMDVAYEPDAGTVIVETRHGSTSTLMRMVPMTVAGVTSEPILQSE